MLKENKDLAPTAALLTAVILWGGSFPAMRTAVQALNPWAVMWGRMVIALIIILPFSGKVFPKNYRAGDWKLLLPAILFQPCLYFLLESNALRYTTSSQAGVIASAVPLLAALGARLFLAESISRKTLVGLFLSLAGVTALTLLQGDDSRAENPLLGNAMELCAMTVGTANLIMIKQLSRRYNPWSLTAMQVGAGTIFFSPGLYFLLKTDAATWTPDLLGAMLFLGGLVTLGAFGLYNWGLSRLPTNRASAFLNLIPVTAVFLGWLWLDETLNVPQLMAAGVVVLGVRLSQVGGNRRVATAPRVQ
ncbi:MAG: DMT family transporter [Pseudomonadota bacterium]